VWAWNWDEVTVVRFAWDIPSLPHGFASLLRNKIFAVWCGVANSQFGGQHAREGPTPCGKSKHCLIATPKKFKSFWSATGPCRCNLIIIIRSGWWCPALASCRLYLHTQIVECEREREREREERRYFWEGKGILVGPSELSICDADP